MVSRVVLISIFALILLTEMADASIKSAADKIADAIDDAADGVSRILEKNSADVDNAVLQGIIQIDTALGQGSKGVEGAIIQGFGNIMEALEDVGHIIEETIHGTYSPKPMVISE